MRTILSGSLAYDRIMDFGENFADHILPDKIKTLNVCFQVNGVKENFGGTAGNIAYALKLLGGEPEISATLGQDNHRYIEWLTSNKISTDKIVLVADELTAGAYITTDKSNNQITGFNPGAMKYSSGLDIESLESGDLLVVSPGNLDDMVNYPKIASKHGISYIFDPGQALPMLSGEDLLSCIDGCLLLILNDYEMSLVMKKTELSQEAIIERTQQTIITLGDKGSTLCQGNTSTHIPSFPAREINDPTGAGDAYRGGLLSGLAKGLSLEESAIRGSACASFAVECYGTQVYSFTMDEFTARLASR